MKDHEKVSTDELWEIIKANAQHALEHTNWVQCLDNIKVLSALIDERIEVFQRRMRTEQLFREHRSFEQAKEDREAVPGERTGHPDRRDELEARFFLEMKYGEVEACPE